MRFALLAFAFIQFLTAGPLYAKPDEPIRLELNVLESADGRCRVSFVINYAFIDSKNSLLLLVLRSLSSRKSMASIVPIGLRMRRRIYIFLS